MHAASLARLLRCAVSAALPLGAAASAASATSGCCPPYVRSEVRAIAGLPPGWSTGPGAFLDDGEGNYHFGSTEDPDIDEAECAVLCGEPVDGCQIVLDCEGPATSGSGGAGGSGEDLVGCDPESGQTPYQMLVLCNATYGASCGRRPAGLRSPPRRPGVSGYFATLAHLEAASVHAFHTLARELRSHRAPPSLVRAAARAAADETRHARAMAALARRFGGPVFSAPAPPPTSPRPLVDIAVENAREGAVRETYGAALALWQSRRAQDPHVRAAFRAIAADEIRHAALAWRVDTWARTRLPTRDRRRVDLAFSSARAALARELAIEPPPDLARIAGAPAAPAAARLAHEVASALPIPRPLAAA
jgi:hypothetical protein